jgi:hypothetical protein
MMGFTGPAHGVHGSSERQATQPVLTQRATVQRLAATSPSAYSHAGRMFGFSVPPTQSLCSIQSLIPFVPVKFIDIFSDIQSIFNCSVVDYTFERGIYG